MTGYSLRNYLEICQVMIKKRVRKDDFIRFFELSRYKYKSDFECIVEMAPRFGIRVYMEEDEICYRVADQALFKQKYKPCTSFYNTYIAFDWANQDITRYYISLRLLLEGDYLKLDSIAEELFLSKSALRSEVKYARDYLDRFGIQVTNVPHHGMKADGEEFRIRMCMNTLLSRYETNLIINSNLNSPAEEFFSGSYDKIDRQVEAIFSRYGFSMSRHDTQYLIRYLIITQKRMSEHPIQYNNGKREEYRSILTSEEYGIAGDLLMGICGNRLSEEHRQDEQMALSTFLICYREYIHVDLGQSYYYAALDCSLARQVCERIIRTLWEKWGLQIYGIAGESLYYACVKLLLKISFGYQEFLSNTSALLQYPLTWMLLCEIRDVFKFCLGREDIQRLSQFYEFSDILVMAYRTQDILFRKFNMAVSSKYGTIHAQRLLAETRSMVDSRYIGHVDVIDGSKNYDISQAPLGEYTFVRQDQNIYIRNREGKLVRTKHSMRQLSVIAHDMLDVCTLNVEEITSVISCAKNLKAITEKFCMENPDLEQEAVDNVIFHARAFKRCLVAFFRQEEAKPRIWLSDMEPIEVNGKLADRCVFVRLDPRQTNCRWLQLFLDEIVYNAQAFERVLTHGIAAANKIMLQYV